MMLNRLLIAVLFVGFFSSTTLAQQSAKDIKKTAKRAAQCEAIFYRLKFRKLALSEDVQQKKVVNENWKFWSNRALKMTPKNKYGNYQKKARKSVIKTGASQATISGCAKERNALLVEGLQSILLGDLGLNKDLAEARRLQEIENAKPENIVFCKHMADRLLSYHAKNVAEFGKEPSKFIVADAKEANDAYDALSSKQKADLESAAQIRVDEVYANRGLKAASDMCMPSFFIKANRVVSPIEAARKRKADREASK
jgi:hypothetical protein